MEGYPRYHRDRANLLIHIVMVPIFDLSLVGVVFGLVTGRWRVALVCLPLLILALGMQGRGHKREPLPPEPFAGGLDFVVRILREQFITFPGFVLSGGWPAALKRSSEARRARS